MDVIFAGAPLDVDPRIVGFDERFAATGFNTGNLLIGDGLARLLDVNILPRNAVHDMEGIGNSAEYLIIPAANFLSPTADLSWLLRILDSSDLPILMIGIGAQFPSADLSEASLSTSTIRAMKIISERSALIGARGEFTASVLGKYGIKNVEVTGCPSLYRSGRRSINVRRPEFAQAKMLFNGSANVTGHSHSPVDAKKAESKIIYLAASSGSPYVLQNEVSEMRVVEGVASASDLSACANTLKTIGCDMSIQEYEAYIYRFGKVFFDLLAWEGFVSNFTLSVGTRFHGNMMALSQGIATIAVIHDSRTLELCRALSIPFVTVEDFSRLSLEEVYDAIDFGDFEMAYRKNRKRIAKVIERSGVPHKLSEKVDFSVPAPTPISGESVVRDQASSGVGVFDIGIVDAIKSSLLSRDFGAAAEKFLAMPTDHPRYVGCAQLVAHSLVGVNTSLALAVTARARLSHPEDLKLACAEAEALKKEGRLVEVRALANTLLPITASDRSEWSDLIIEYSKTH